MRLKDANIEARSDAVVRAVQFHRAGELLLTAGLDKTVRLFHVDGKKNEKVHSVFFEDLPIYSAFFGDGARFVRLTFAILCASLSAQTCRGSSSYVYWTATFLLLL